MTYMRVGENAGPRVADVLLTISRGTPLRLGCESSWCSSNRAVSNFSFCSR